MEFDRTASGRSQAGEDFFVQLASWMRAQPAVSYALEDIRPGAYIEYPLPQDPTDFTYAWIGYWADDVDRQVAKPILTIAASPIAEIENVQDRLGLGRREEWLVTADSLTFQGRDVEQSVPIYQVQGGRHAAIGIDGSDGFVAMSSSHSFDFAAQKITIVTDRERFIQQWLSSVAPNLDH